jgi:hypothetical protein
MRADHGIPVNPTKYDSAVGRGRKETHGCMASAVNADAGKNHFFFYGALKSHS